MRVWAVFLTGQVQQPEPMQEGGVEKLNRATEVESHNRRASCQQALRDGEDPWGGVDIGLDVTLDKPAVFTHLKGQVSSAGTLATQVRNSA